MACTCSKGNQTLRFPATKKPLKKISAKFESFYQYKDATSEGHILQCGFCKCFFVCVIQYFEEETKVELNPINQEEFEKLISRKSEFDYMCQREGAYYLFWG